MLRKKVLFSSSETNGLNREEVIRYWCIAFINLNRI